MDVGVVVWWTMTHNTDITDGTIEALVRIRESGLPLDKLRELTTDTYSAPWSFDGHRYPTVAKPRLGARRAAWAKPLRATLTASLMNSLRRAGCPNLTDPVRWTSVNRDETRQCHARGYWRGRRFGQRLPTMTVTSIARIAVPSLALIAAATLVFGIPRVWRERPVENVAATTAPAVAPPASSVRDEASAAPPTALAIVVPTRSPGSEDGIMPGFDISLVGRAGDAVIAGTAAPGASLELLRNGEVHDRTVADRSGQFVMVPPQLPPGDYELTLRSTQPDGKQATSQQSVAVSLKSSLKDQLDVALMTPSEILSKPAAPSTICHPSRAQKRWPRPNCAAPRNTH